MRDVYVCVLHLCVYARRRGRLVDEVALLIEHGPVGERDQVGDLGVRHRIRAHLAPHACGRRGARQVRDPSESFDLPSPLLDGRSTTACARRGLSISLARSRGDSHLERPPRRRARRRPPRRTRAEKTLSPASTTGQAAQSFRPRGARRRRRTNLGVQRRDLSARDLVHVARHRRVVHLLVVVEGVDDRAARPFHLSEWLRRRLDLDAPRRRRSNPEIIVPSGAA